MIKSFADQATEDIFHGADTKAARSVSKDIWPTARRKLDALNAAHESKDLQSPPGNRLEKLKGRLAGKWSIRVNDQYRIVFKFENGSALQVQVTDYH